MIRVQLALRLQNSYAVACEPFSLGHNLDDGLLVLAELVPHSGPISLDLRYICTHCLLLALPARIESIIHKNVAEVWVVAASQSRPHLELSHR